MRKLHLRTAMAATASLGLALWLIRDYPLALALVLFLSPTFVLTHRFLRCTAERGRRLSRGERLSAWLLLSSFLILIEILSLVAVVVLVGLLAMLLEYLAGQSPF